MDAFALQCPKERNLFRSHPRLAVGMIQVVMLRPLLRGNGLLRQTMKLSQSAVEQRQNAVGVACDDAGLHVVKHRLKELLLTFQCLRALLLTPEKEVVGLRQSHFDERLVDEVKGNDLAQMRDGLGETVHVGGHGGSKILYEECDQGRGQELEHVAIELAPVADQQDEGAKISAAANHQPNSLEEGYAPRLPR